MATKHWVRDVSITDPNCSSGNQLAANAILYHFLRVAGFNWLWEAGNQGHAVNPNWVSDGNMENPTNPPPFWTATLGASVSKVTSPVDSGTQALEVTNVGSGGVRSSDMGLAPNPVTVTAQNGASMSGPDTKGKMTFDYQSSLITQECLGMEVEVSGDVASGNNGRFAVVGWPDSTADDEVIFWNPSGVAKSYATGTDEATITLRPIFVLTLVVSNSGPSLAVNVDRGDGVPFNVGTIPNNGGVYTRYSFSFSLQGSGATYVYVENASSGPSFYIDSMHVFRSSFEYYMARDEAVSGADQAHYGFTNNLAPNHYGVDGALTNPDQFSTGAGDNYSPGAADVGKHLFVWDPVNNKNSGCYEIIADVGGGVVQVNLRSGSAAFVNASGLRWRIVNIYQDSPPGNGVGPFGNINMPDWQQSCGFGIESPHTSKWRFFMRQNQNGGQNVKSSEMWSAPVDTDFDQDSGTFWTSGPSVNRNRAGQWSRNAGASGDNPNIHTWRGNYNYSVNATTRTFVMTDENLSFFTLAHMSPNNDQHGYFFVGYHDPDADHPGVMSFVHLARWEDISVSNEIFFDQDADRFGINGTSFDQNELAVRCCLSQLGYGESTDSVHQQSVAAPNQWSGEEWLQELRITNDPYGAEGVPSNRDAGVGIGVFQGRINISELSTFDSDQYLHIDNGLVWEWSGESILP